LIAVIYLLQAKRDAGTSFLIFSENCQKFTMSNTQIWILLKNFKCKDIFLSSSLDPLLSSASRNVFAGSVAQSV